jgi:phosphoribosylformylglycinamidine synthase
MSLVGSQGLINKKVVAFGHDINDGSIIVALLEMAFASNCGIYVDSHVLDIHGTINAKFVALFTKEQQSSW